MTKLEQAKVEHMLWLMQRDKWDREINRYELLERVKCVACKQKWAQHYGRECPTTNREEWAPDWKDEDFT